MKVQNAERYYTELGHLLVTPPDVVDAAIRKSPETQRWLSKFYALVSAGGSMVDAVTVAQCMDGINMGLSIPTNLTRMLSIGWRVLGVLELHAPAASQGTFIGAGNVFDAAKAVGTALKDVKKEVLIVDPYMCEKTLTEFAVLIPGRASIQLLTETGKHKPSLAPSVSRWQAQYGEEWPLECRVTAKGALHDRLIVVDNAVVWLISQSLNALGVRSPASVTRVDPSTAELKVGAYRQLWDGAETTSSVQVRN